MSTKVFNSAKYGTVTVTSSTHKRTMTKYVVDKVITHEEACIIQLQLGYHPHGYGVYGFETKSTTTSWCRGNSCD
jgi:hypothetical protein